MFTLGIALIVAASAFFFLRAVGTTQLVGVGTAATLLGCAMAIVAAGSLLPSVEDWFGGRRELRIIEPLLDELERRHPDVGIGERPRGPLVFRVAERLSLISDALYLEATWRRPRAGTRLMPPASRRTSNSNTISRTCSTSRCRQGTRGTGARHRGMDPRRARRIASRAARSAAFPGLGWLRQPTSYSDREWILAIATQYRQLDRSDAPAQRLIDVGDCCRAAALRQPTG